MVAAASTREVVFLLKAPVDPQAAAGFRQIAQLARTAQAEIQKGQKETADQDAKLRRERIRDFEKEQSEVNKIRKAAAAEESKDQKEALRAAAAAQAERLRISKEAAAEEEQDRRESLRAGTAAEKERQRMAEETATAQVLAAKTAEKQKQLAVKQTEQVERESQRASEAFNKSLISLAASRNGILLGAMHVARGVALLMSSNEKEAHKLLEKMMMIQGPTT